MRPMLFRKYDFWLCTEFDKKRVEEEIFPLLTQCFLGCEDEQVNVLLGEKEEDPSVFLLTYDRGKLFIRIMVGPEKSEGSHSGLYEFYLHAERALFSKMSNKEFTQRMQQFLTGCLEKGKIYDTLVYPGWSDMTDFVKRDDRFFIGKGKME
ncbi:MAG: hypothetical protein J5531_07465 [Lachnospiraceae bacterium]|nr:hypothetical protein [Lachnospiraceae bacterium]